MARKHDLDNRSNQLNPNNDAYHSSRSHSRCEDDLDVEDWKGFAPTVSTPRAQKVSRSATYGFGAVSVSKKAAFVTATFNATASPFSLDAVRDCNFLHDKFSEEFTPIARNHLKNVLGNDALALFAVFDPSTDRLPWHVPLHLEDLGKTASALRPETCAYLASALRPSARASDHEEAMYRAFSSRVKTGDFTKMSIRDKLDPEPYISALREAVSAEAPSLGEFQVPHDGLISLADSNVILRKLAELRGARTC
ncbi:hypothetical protein [Paracidovorax sp. MALMAid1276]|uniref:hypothetical protein n=1 Tax=Paracidovorax sp. MALMAid1276 TaxID=3411631 RepID=UPI003B9C0A4D